ncbi:MAG: hypothetical protein ACFFC7_30360 [Candidatus Hermodarchaeota archaeon]
MKEYKVIRISSMGRVKEKIIEQKINEMVQAGWKLEQVTHPLPDNVYAIFARES